MNTNVDENVNSFAVNGQNTQNVRSVCRQRLQGRDNHTVSKSYQSFNDGHGRPLL